MCVLMRVYVRANARVCAAMSVLVLVHARQREAMRLAAGNEGQAAEAKLEAKSAGGKEWEWEFLFFYRCRTSLIEIDFHPIFDEKNSKKMSVNEVKRWKIKKTGDTLCPAVHILGT